jgi:hypothetical protein
VFRIPPQVGLLAQRNLECNLECRSAGAGAHSQVELLKRHVWQIRSEPPERPERHLVIIRRLNASPCSRRRRLISNPHAISLFPPSLPSLPYRFLSRACRSLFPHSGPLFAMRSFSTLLLALSLPFYVLAGHVDSRAHRHAEVALRARGHVLQKRFSGPFTYYDITVGPYGFFPLPPSSMSKYFCSVACQGQHFPASAFVSDQ